jgi:transposase
VLDRIGALFAIESQIRGRSAEERRAVRQARAGPLLEALHQWFQSTLSKLSRKSPLALAIRYGLTRWIALTRFRDNGHLEMEKAMISYCTSLAGLSWAGILSVH